MFGRSAHFVSFLAGPEAVIQDDIQTEREAARPQRFEQLQNRLGLLREALLGRIVSKQAGHPLAGVNRTALCSTSRRLAKLVLPDPR
jgi:hypothetical protein